MKRILLVCLLCSFLFGCGAPSIYKNRGFSDAQVESDYLDCQMKAGAASHGDSFKESLYTVRCMKSLGY